MPGTAYTPDSTDATKRRRKGRNPHLRTWGGKPVRAKYRRFTMRIPAQQYREWLFASGATEYRDLCIWLASLADREFEASLNPS